MSKGRKISPPRQKFLATPLRFEIFSGLLATPLQFAGVNEIPKEAKVGPKITNLSCPKPSKPWNFVHFHFSAFSLFQSFSKLWNFVHFYHILHVFATTKLNVPFLGSVSLFAQPIVVVWCKISRLGIAWRWSDEPGAERRAPSRLTHFLLSVQVRRYILLA